MPPDYSGQNLRGRSFKGQNLAGANFSYADIRSVNFTGANLRGAYIEDWNITHKTNFRNVRCEYVYMRCPTKENPNPLRKPDNNDEVFTELPEADKEKSLRYLGAAKEETQAPEADKQLAAGNLKRMAQTIETASKTVESGKTLWGNVKPILKELPAYFGVAATFFGL